MSKTYLIKVYKPGTKLYRTAMVPGSITLEQLHEAIHEWMEFPTYEMYAFFPNNKLLSESGYYAPQMKKKSASDVTLDGLELRKGQRILYVYDMTELMQFYIHIDEIEERETEEIRLLRRNGHLTFHKEEEPDPALYMADPDVWIVEEQDLDMRVCMASNDLLELVDTAHCMNIPVKGNTDADTLAAGIHEALMQDPQLVIRLLPLHLLHALEQIWKTSDGEEIRLPYEFLVRLSLVGMLSLEETEQSRYIVCSREGQKWLTGVLDSPDNMRAVEKYAKWNAAARGMIYTYGVIQMDDFYRMFKRYAETTADIDEVCDFMMQRMEWNEECHAIQDEEDLYWSAPSPEKAAVILSRRRQYERRYKPLSRREIFDNAETAGWQRVDCGQELFEALQGAAMEPDEVREVLNEIVHDFAIGMEPSEILRECIPPMSQIGRVAHNKIRIILRRIKRQLPDYVYMGFSQQEIEENSPESRTIEGFQIIKGGKNKKIKKS